MKNTGGTAVGNELVTINRRRKERRQDSKSEAPENERRKPNRRRQIDPTTCERDYSQDELDFMRAMDDYKRRAGRQFPTCSEVLEVIRSIGYVKLDEEQRAMLHCEEFQGYDPEAGAGESEEEADELAEL